MAENTPSQHDATRGFRRGKRSWIGRFALAFRGVKVAVCAEANFYLHLFVTAVVVVAAAVLEISRLEWCLIVLCIVTVLSAELLNTSIERIAQAITQEEDPRIRDALDIASGAVLVVAIGAAILGVFILGSHALEMLLS